MQQIDRQQQDKTDDLGFHPRHAPKDLVVPKSDVHSGCNDQRQRQAQRAIITVYEEDQCDCSGAKHGGDKFDQRESESDLYGIADERTSTLRGLVKP